jgi:prophage regulatory protein
MAAPGRKVIRVQQVLEMTCLTRGTLYRYVKENSFPQPIQLGPRLNAWYEDEIAEWLATRPRGLHSAEDARRLRSVPRPTRVPA